MKTDTDSRQKNGRAIFGSMLVCLAAAFIVSCSLAESTQSPTAVSLAPIVPTTEREQDASPIVAVAAPETASVEEGSDAAMAQTTPTAEATLESPPTAIDPSPNSISGIVGADLVPFLAFEDPKSEVTALAISPVDQRIAFALSDGSVHLMNPDGSDLLASSENHSARIRDLAFSPDGATLASAGEDSLVFIWDTLDGSLVKKISTSFVGRALALEFSPDGSQLAIGGHKCFIALYAVWSGILNRTLVQPGCSMKQEGSVNYWSLSYSPDGSELIAAEGQPSGSGGSIENWTLDPVPRPEIIKGLGVGYSTLAVSPDRTQIAAVQIGSSRILLIAADDGGIINTLESHQYRVNSLAYSPDGKILVSGSTDGTVRLWDPASGLLLRTLQDQGAPVNSVAISPDGSLIASGSEAGQVVLWSVGTVG